MTELTAQSLNYRHEGTDHVGYLVCEPGTPRPGVLLIHDAFGVSEPMKQVARSIAEQGYTVLLGDLWGGGRTPSRDEEIGPLIGAMARDRELWTGRVQAAHEQLQSRSECEEPITVVGYCFGGSSALEYVRSGGQVAAAVSIHAGLDLVSIDWTGANADASVLILTGALDPMSPPAVVSAITDGMTAAGVRWEVASYGQARHAFTNPHADRAGRPDVLAYDARAAARAWASFILFLDEMRAGVGAHV